MADYAKGRLRGKRRELQCALEGTFTDEQRWLLERGIRQAEWLEAQVEILEREIERRVAVYEDAIQRLVTIPGIDRKTAWTIVAEVGADLSAFADARHLASWAGLCPGNRESGGKRFSGRVRKANRYLKRVMCQAAWAASHTKKTYLSAFYRRMCIRKGAPKAIMALAHHMIVVIYQVISRSESYVEFGGDYYDQQSKPKTVARLVARLAKLGYQVDLKRLDETSAHGPLPFEILPTPDSKVEAPPDAIKPTQRKRGRPCKCQERGIMCKHGTSAGLNSLIPQPLEAGEFS
jgi:transposase